MNKFFYVLLLMFLIGFAIWAISFKSQYTASIMLKILIPVKRPRVPPIYKMKRLARKNQNLDLLTKGCQFVCEGYPQTCFGSHIGFFVIHYSDNIHVIHNIFTKFNNDVLLFPSFECLVGFFVIILFFPFSGFNVIISK